MPFVPGENFVYLLSPIDARITTANRFQLSGNVSDTTRVVTAVAANFPNALFQLPPGTARRIADNNSSNTWKPFNYTSQEYPNKLEHDTFTEPGSIYSGNSFRSVNPLLANNAVVTTANYLNRDELFISEKDFFRYYFQAFLAAKLHNDRDALRTGQCSLLDWNNLLTLNSLANAGFTTGASLPAIPAIR